MWADGLEPAPPRSKGAGNDVLLTEQRGGHVDAEREDADIVPERNHGMKIDQPPELGREDVEVRDLSGSPDR